MTKEVDSEGDAKSTIDERESLELPILMVALLQMPVGATTYFLSRR